MPLGVLSLRSETFFAFLLLNSSPVKREALSVAASYQRPEWHGRQPIAAAVGRSSGGSANQRRRWDWRRESGRAEVCCVENWFPAVSWSREEVSTGGLAVPVQVHSAWTPLHLSEGQVLYLFRSSSSTSQNTFPPQGPPEVPASFRTGAASSSVLVLERYGLFVSSPDIVIFQCQSWPYHKPTGF